MKQFMIALRLTLASSASADITVKFEDGAPKDRFTISSDCTISDLQVVIDLTQSAGSLIFDVTASGAGVEVFQPVEIQAGVVRFQPVIDGDRRLAFEIATIGNQSDVVISADLDDVPDDSPLGQIRVAGTELDGASVRIDIMGTQQSATFAGGTNQVQIPFGCLS